MRRQQHPRTAKTPNQDLVDEKKVANTSEVAASDLNYLETFLYFLRKKAPTSPSKHIYFKSLDKQSESQLISPEDSRQKATVSKYKALLMSEYLLKMNQRSLNQQARSMEAAKT